MSENPTAATPRSLFALVVGINEYKFVAPLHGCVGDATGFADYLKEPYVTDVFDVNLLTLFDEEATKTRIVEGWQNHLGQAGENDVACFFFAGHGSREQTTIEAFRHAEVDGKIGNIVCVDSKVPREPGACENTFLADKELRYLIHELSANGAEVLTVFDCCHSGDNTRDVLGDDPLPANARKISRGASLARGWGGFIFHEQINLDDLDNTKELDLVIPQGNHIQLAACRDVETAWEFDGSGAFTKAFLETLRSHNGQIRYHDLYSRVKNRMVEKGDKAQTPQVYFQTGNPASRFNLFLSNQPDDRPAFASVIYNRDKDEWRINLGALHGIPMDAPQSSSSPVKVSVYPKDRPAEKIPAAIKMVSAGHAVIDAGSGALDQSEVYRATVSGLAIRPLDVYVSGDADGIKLATEGLSERISAAGLPYAQLVETEADADFVLRAENGVLTTTRPGFAKQPIVQPISYQDADGSLLPDKVGAAYADLVQMAKWTFLKDLEYRPAFPEQAPPGKSQFPVELKIFQLVFDDEGNEVEIERDHSRGTVTIEMTHDKDTGRRFTRDTKNPLTYFRMELQNHSQKELYCTVVYLSQEFGVSYPFFEQEELALDPGRVTKSRMIGSKPHVPARIPPYIREDNWDGLHEFAKLIVSEEQFDANSLRMDGLPDPRAGRMGASRGAFDFDDEDQDLPQQKYWSTYTIELFTMNPFLHVES